MISLSEAASNKIKKQIAKRGKGIGIKVGVKTTGCSGLAYVLEFVDTINQYDTCVESLDCKIFIDPKACPYIQGMTIDYVRKGLNEGFEFLNPNERDRCGCGESFRI
jgi:iron-sulfur cluster assembly protein